MTDGHRPSVAPAVRDSARKMADRPTAIPAPAPAQSTVPAHGDMDPLRQTRRSQFARWLHVFSRLHRLRPPHLPHLPYARHNRWRLAALGGSSMALVLEIVPVAGALLLLAAWVQGYTVLPLPVWWLLALVLVAYALGVVPREALGTSLADLAGQRPFVRRLVSVMAILSALSIWAGTFFGSIVLAVLSSVTYRQLPRELAVDGFVRDLRTGNNQPQVTVILLGAAILTAYLWWRGLTLARRQLTRERLAVSFRTGLFVLVATVVLAQPMRVSARDQLDATLAFLLPIEMFVGLTGLALAHLADTARTRQERQERQRRSHGDGSEAGENGDEGGGNGTSQIEGMWFVMVLAVSGGIVAGALGMTVLIWNSGGHAVSSALGRLFAPLPVLPTQPHGAVGGGSGGGLTRPGSNAGIAVGAGGLPTLNSMWFAAVLGLTAVVGILLLWARLRERPRRTQEYEEVRERLKAREVLKERWRGLTPWVTWRGQHVDARVAEEELPPGSVRYLYREVLRSAAHAGRGRAVHETPAEYAQRLTSKAGGAFALTEEDGSAAQAHAHAHAHDAGNDPAPETTTDALAVLTNAYVRARYGAGAGASGEESTTVEVSASAAVREAQERVIRWLNTLRRY
jgi:Domain of unknown function (DUF4129)